MLNVEREDSGQRLEAGSRRCEVRGTKQENRPMKADDCPCKAEGFMRGNTYLTYLQVLAKTKRKN